MRYFEFQDAKSSKFWQVEEDGANLVISWGRIGNQGQTQTKEFASSDKAAAEAAKLIKAKTSKGYVEVVDGGSARQTTASAAAEQAPAEAPTTQAPEPEGQPAAPQAAPPAADEGEAPWLRRERIIGSDVFRSATRRNPRDPEFFPAADDDWTRNRGDRSRFNCTSLGGSQTRASHS